MRGKPRVVPSSFIRTVGRPGERVGLTVGSGIRPDLLTLRIAAKALAGSFVGASREPTAGGEFRPALKTLAGEPARAV